MPGSEANPVILDPFRTIIEVGWSKVPEYILITIQIQGDSEGGEDAACPIPTETPFPYSGYVTSSYLVSLVVDNRIVESKPYNLSATGYWKHKQEELTVDSGDHPVTISGVPTGPFIDVSPSAWEYSYVGIGSNSGHAVRIVAMSTADGSYSDPAYDIPGDLYETTTQDLEAVAHAITDTAECGYISEDPPIYQPKPAAPTPSATPDPDQDVFFSGATLIGTGAVNVAGVSVTYRETTYSPVAISGDDVNDYMSGDPDSPSGRRSINILCKRDSGTA